MVSRRKKACGKCGSWSFTVQKGFTKPEFRCTCCDSTWSYGYDGGWYLQSALNYDGSGPDQYVEYKWVGKDFVKL